ncbi:hypothetical protein DY000_02032054 [Brassica cretica]|uniref:Uncharacterized protein n=1 Tax=Brassica cretica TaxID=69181 RepID=A0ABQ7DVM6_BRACR|nr:hypothetical protein DY000_02032054 [Brassica cretica]
MFEEVESKWVKTAEIGHKRNSTYRGNYRGDGEVSHYRNTRREEPRHDAQERRTRVSSEQSRVQDDQKVPREEAKEEGEIKDAGEGEVKLMEEDLMDQPSQKFQEELAKTIAAGAEIVSNSTDTEKRLQEVQGLLEEKMESPEDEENLMGMDEIKALINWNMGLTWMQLMTCRTCQMWKLRKRSWHMTRMRSHKRRRKHEDEECLSYGFPAQESCNKDKPPWEGLCLAFALAVYENFNVLVVEIIQVAAHTAFGLIKPSADSIKKEGIETDIYVGE